MPDSVSLERLREVLDYDPDTGIFRWKQSFVHRVKGGVAGADVRGYVVIQIDGVRIRAHRLAWLWVHGSYPIALLDHINAVRSDNRIANLRNATHSQNSANRQNRPDNKVGLKGVYRHKARESYVAEIVKEGERMYLGSFATPELAHEAYVKAAKELFGEFARAG